MRKGLRYAVIAAAALAVIAFAAFQLSPWPSVLLIRRTFDAGSAAASQALEKHVPSGLAEVLGEPYDPGSPDASLDVYYPASAQGVLPLIVWVHGGGFVSGRKEDVANYLRVLAGKGYTVVSVGYSIAPGATYPTPVRQLNAALAYLQKNSARLHADPESIFLAGDSAGAQIAGQTANVITSAGYAAEMQLVPSVAARQIRGVILFCGPYGTDGINFDGPFGGFLGTVLWAYLGTKAFRTDPRLVQFSVAANLTKAFPPVFMSVGNADPLAPLSVQLKEKAEALGVPVDALFFAKDYQPPLPHEYQFNLDGEAGRTALERVQAFIEARRSTPPP